MAFAGLLYWLGGLGRRRRADDGVRTAAFVAGLVTIVVALDSPIDRYAEQLFWVHMLQHILLLTVAPPLILLGRPWPRMWRGLPLGLANERRAQAIARGALASPLRALARPLPAWVLFNVTLIAWHIPAHMTRPCARAPCTRSSTRCSSSRGCCSGRA